MSNFDSFFFKINNKNHDERQSSKGVPLRIETREEFYSFSEGANREMSLNERSSGTIADVLMKIVISRKR
jgi:hypothetical protein